MRRNLNAGSRRLMTMGTRLLAPLVAAVAVAGGCGGGGGATSSTVTTIAEGEAAPASTEEALSTVLAASTSQSATSTSAAVDGWEQSSAVLVTDGIVTQSDFPGEVLEVHAIGSTSAGYLVAGSVNGGFALWRSEDLELFEPVYSKVFFEHNLRASSIAEFDDTLLIGGTGGVGVDGREQAFMLRSDDRGVSWALIEHPIFTSDANRVDRMVVTENVVLVQTVDDREPGAQPQSVPAWSDDLTTWHPVELPERQPDDWPSFWQGHETVFAVSERNDGPEGRFASRVIWRSDDGGRRFVEASTLTDAEFSGFLSVGDTLVAVPSNYQTEYRHVDVRGLLVLDDDGQWRELEPDTGTWGDGSASAYRTVASQRSDRTYTLVTRTLRASAHYCYDDVDSCQQWETALLATEDGMTWYDVAGFPTENVRGDPKLLTTDLAGDIVLLATSYPDPQIHITRWTASSPPPLVDNPDYAAPNIPIQLYEHDQPFNVGDERRYPLGTGGCGGMYIDGQRWKPDSPLPDPPPPDWPFRPVEIVDGPEGYVYGRIHRLSSNTIEFSIEGLGAVATFRPAPPSRYVCG